MLAETIAKNRRCRQVVDPVAIESVRGVTARRTPAGPRIEEVLDGIEGVAAKVGSRIASSVGEALAPRVVDASERLFENLLRNELCQDVYTVFWQAQ